MNLETLPCETCGEPTTFTGTKRCNACWEFERLIDNYIKSANGRRFVLRKLNTIDVQPLKRWIGKERARFDRIGKSDLSTFAGKERAFGEANVCSLILGKINERLRHLRIEIKEEDDAR